MALLRTAKTIAARLDRTYINRTNRPRLVRRGLIGFCCAGALVAWGALAAREGDNQYSPGKLTSAHAMWDGGQNCAWCHESQGDGKGFQLAVTDKACLRCHDGAVHHPNQATMVSFGADKSVPAKSSNCVECHVEHRGHELLVSKTDATCTKCHADLRPTAAKPDKVAVHPNVTAFAADQHPPFGRSLAADKSQPWPAAGTPKLTDPTPLRYNHELHQTSASARTPAPPGEVENCTACHRPAMDAGGRTGRGDIAPVSYEADCKRCHQIELAKGSGLIVPHESMDVVRPFLAAALADPAAHFRQVLDAMPPAERAAELEKVRPKAAAPAARGPFGAKPAAAAAPLTPDQLAERWVAGRAAPIVPALKRWYEEISPDDRVFEAFRSAARLPEPGSPDAEAKAPWKDARVAGFYIARAQAREARCGLCHDLSLDQPAVDRLALGAGPPMSAAAVLDVRPPTPPAVAAAATSPATTAPTAAATTAPAAVSAARPIVTLPTGFADGPRRWFVSDRVIRGVPAAAAGPAKQAGDPHRWPATSHFDHRAHRMVSCVDCHTEAKGSAKTTDVLLPTMQSCTTCHAPQTSADAGGGAGVNCTLCHQFHERGTERSPDGSFRPSELIGPKPPATRPAATTGPAVAAR